MKTLNYGSCSFSYMYMYTYMNFLYLFINGLHVHNVIFLGAFYIILYTYTHTYIHKYKRNNIECFQKISCYVHVSLPINESLFIQAMAEQMCNSEARAAPLQSIFMQASASRIF